MKNQIKHTFNITLMIIIMSVAVVFAVSRSYFEYNNNLNNVLMSQAQTDLSYSTQLSKQVINTKINSITSNLENLALSLSRLDSHKDSECINEILSTAQQHNHIHTLNLISPQVIKDFYGEYIQTLTMGNQVIFIDDNNSYIQVLTPMIISNKLDGCLVASYTVSDIGKLLTHSTFNGQGTALIMQNDSTILADVDIGESNNFIDYLESAYFLNQTSLKTFKSDLAAGNNNVIHYRMNGTEWYAQYFPMDIYGLMVYNQVPAHVFEAKTTLFTNLAESIFRQIIFIMIIFILFILVIQIFNNKNIKHNQLKLLLEKDRYQTVLSHSQGAVWEYDIATDTMTKSDPDLGIYTTLPVIPNYKKYIEETAVIHPDFYPVFEKFYQGLQGGQKEIQYELKAKDISGKMVWFELSGTTIYDSNGLPVSVIGQTVNIDARKRELEELRDNANRDSLTKLFNRTALKEQVDQLLQSNDDTMNHALFMIDLDNFKGINDTYGHTFGDAVLIELSNKLNKYFKEPHLISRLGGDEFVVFLYNVPSEHFIVEKAEKVISIFRKMFIGEENNHKISGSVGISIYPEHGTTFRTLLNKSDIALYHSKSLGKDCYSIYEDTMTDVIQIPDSDQNHLESRYQMEDRSLIDSSIIANTVNLLFDAKDINSSINLILSVIGNYYNLDCINITEFSDDLTTASITFEWCSESDKRIASYMQKVPIETMSKYIFYKSAEDAVYYNNDMRNSDAPTNELSQLFESYDVSSTFQCAIYENSTNKGFINAFLYNSNRGFSKPEVSSMTLLSKIIGGYLLKLRAQEKANLIATKDPLTNSYNLFQFTIEAGKIVDNNPDKNFIIIYTDLDKFKLINETYGYSEGDRVLIEFANKLRFMTKENEIIGRVSADRFVGLFQFDNKDSFLRRLERFNKDLNTIPKTQTDNYKLTVIIGLYPITGSDNMSLNIDRANIARKSITERHKSTFIFFNETMKSSLVKQREIEDIMEDALKNHEFIIYYQPKFKLSTNTICGAEALIRWNRPGVGLIPPNEFIPIFEENGFIIDIDYYVFDKVCAHIRSLLDRELRAVPISVNFSRLHLKNRNLVAHLKNTIFRYDIPASLIEIEITESALVDDNNYLLSILHEIHNAGFRLSMDDFGSGLSSLNMLRTMPFDVLKLDKNFFHGSATTEREKVVITNVVKMAKELYMEIVSEGIETEEQAQLLRTIECPVAQGYLFERPIPMDLFEEKYCN